MDQITVFGIGHILTSSILILLAAATHRSFRSILFATIITLSLIAFRILLELVYNIDITDTFKQLSSAEKLIFLCGLISGSYWLILIKLKDNMSLWLFSSVHIGCYFCILGLINLLLYKQNVGLPKKSDISAPSIFASSHITDFNSPPLKLAVKDDKIFVSFNTADGGNLHGGIWSVYKNDLGYKTKVALSSPIFFRPHGLAIDGDSILILRSGLLGHATNGKIHYTGAGALTRAEDRDRNGEYEYWSDVVTELPGVRGPDTLHQTSGIAVDDDGTIFIANSFDHNRSLDSHPYAGTVLRIKKGSTPEIFAHGLRNPWALTIGPNGELFGTDNDTEENPGDEFNHIIKGEHYGHPYAIPNEKNVFAKGFKNPILNLPDHVLTGLTYVPRGAWPAPYDDSFYISDLVGRKILQVKLEFTPNNGINVISSTVFAKAPSPIDIEFDNGSLYVLSRYHQRLYKIGLK